MSNPLAKNNNLYDSHDEIIDRMSDLYVDCPECENIIHSDEQYQCGTCSGGSRIYVLDWVAQLFKVRV